MNVEFTENAWEEFSYWITTDIAMVTKIKELLAEIRKAPFRGIGKPEPLKYDLKGYWSRRISGEHRLVYKVEGNKGVDQRCYILQCRFHYDPADHSSASRGRWLAGTIPAPAPSREKVAPFY